MTGSMQVETESAALESLVLAPVAPAAIFYGKAIANSFQLLMVGLVSLPPTLVLCDAGLKESGLSLLAVMLAGCLGIAGPGTFYAALTARLASRQLLLPLLLFPLLMPCLLAAVKATSLLLQGDAMGQAGSWLGLLIAFDLLYWSVGGALFSKVIET
jgi:heme exporter protein B